jgi:purine-binding chemotaxis protein CheW
METNKQYFLFISNNDIYAIEALDVIEIVEYQNITKVPMMSSFVKGVTNIRGNIIAVVDLLQRFELEETKVLDKTSLAILRKKYLDKELQIAIIIDEVYEVDNISDVNIELTPSFGTRVDKKFIKSMAKYNDEFVPILDIDAILDIEEISVLTAFKKDK